MIHIELDRDDYPCAELIAQIESHVFDGVALPYALAVRWDRFGSLAWSSNLIAAPARALLRSLGRQMLGSWGEKWQPPLVCGGWAMCPDTCQECLMIVRQIAPVAPTITEIIYAIARKR